jgi:hypothetical protein
MSRQCKISWCQSTLLGALEARAIQWGNLRCTLTGTETARRFGSDDGLQGRSWRAEEQCLNSIANDLKRLVIDHGESIPTGDFQSVIQRAMVHVQSPRREEATRGTVFVATFAERESRAAYFLQPMLGAGPLAIALTAAASART